MKIRCCKCGENVSTEVPDETIVRGWVECPECIEKAPDFQAELAKCREEKVELEAFLDADRERPYKHSGQFFQSWRKAFVLWKEYRQSKQAKAEGGE